MARKKTHLFVISDLHLGGPAAAGGRPAFQMCTDRGRGQLARFIGWAGGRISEEWDVQLVLAGDIVDFLAEERGGGFQAFTGDDRLATDKLAAIFEDTGEVWRALGQFVRRGGALTLMLGNHDLELSLPGPRRLLLEALGPGRVEFIYDNQAFTFGHLVLVEHGNRYDDWNAVPHDSLREVRSRLSRGQPASFEPLPGSRMVVDLVNPTKTELAFVDLLKPETAALLPFLALLSPDRFGSVVTTLKNGVRARRVRYGAGQQPRDENYIVGTTGQAPIANGQGTGDGDDDALLALAEEAAAGGDPAMAGGLLSFIDRWRAKLAAAYREGQLDLLLKVLRAFRGSHQRAFDIGVEESGYLAAATESAACGYQVVVYGHTHLPKRISLTGRKASDGRVVAPGAIYLNTGTWADVMALPSDLLAPEGSPESDGARERLRVFADDLAHNRLDRWRRHLPTFAAIDVEEGRVTKADVEILADGERAVPISNDLVRAQLERSR